MSICEQSWGQKEPFGKGLKISHSLDQSLPVRALVLGSGLADIAEEFDLIERIGYESLADFPKPGVGGHKGELWVCRTSSCNLLVLRGRAHYYEKGDIHAMRGAIATLHALGCQHLIITNAAGSLRSELSPGSLMLINDHINWSGLSPLTGIRSDKRFVDMGAAYDGAESKKIKQVAAKAGVDLGEGVYVFFLGPQFETPAEIRAAGILGGQAVGMSTVPEVVLARFYGIKVSAVSIITNMAAGLSSERLSQEHTVANAQHAFGDLRKLLVEYLA